MIKIFKSKAGLLFLFTAFLLGSSAGPLFVLAQTVIDPNFNPNYIISDSEILHTNAMSLSEIQAFLETKGSYLARYSCKNWMGEVKTAAQIIYDASNNSYDCSLKLSDAPTVAEISSKCVPVKTVNPKFLLVLLQKEMSLIDETAPTQSQLDWAVGYGCPDGSKCLEYWRGFGKQVNSAALQFKDYIVSPQLYKYRAGETYTFTNPYGTISNEPMTVTPANQATAALYNYTPHVYNGNYNFYKLWLRYFVINYPDGSLLQAEGEAGVFLIQNGKRRAFMSRGALTSRYDINKIIIVNRSDIDKYPLGDPIKFAQYSFVRSPRGTVYLLADDTKRGFASGEALRKIGINPEEIEDVSFEDLNFFIEGAPITATSTYPSGALLQNKKTGGIYFVMDGVKQALWDKIFLATKFKNKKPIPVAPEELDKYLTGEPVKFGDGELMKSSLAPGVYLLANGAKRAFISGEVFEKMGYRWANVITVPQKVLNLYPEGDIISGVNNQI
ncbi:MAG: hypothetical protein WCW25_00150 [Patescibacteria group bacterium]|jgi:hypothetical protein